MSRGAAVVQFRGNIAGAAWRHACTFTTARADTAIALLMTELDASSGHTTEDHGASTFSLVRRQLPFLAILALAIGGVAYTNFSQQPLVGYWELLAIAMGVVCVITQWSEFEDKQARFRLMWT